MERIIQRLYVFCAIIFTIGFLSLLVGFRLNIQKPFQQEGFHEVEAKLVSSYEDKKASGGRKTIYQIDLRNTEHEFQHLVFYTIHQEVKVLVKDKCIYNMHVRKSDSVTKSPGCVWNDVLLTPEEKNNFILIEVTPVYKSTNDEISVIYLGTKGAIVKKILSEELPEFSMSFLAILLGLMFVGYVKLNNGNSEIDKSLGFLGLFAVMVGSWKMGDGRLLKLFFPSAAYISMLPFVSLMLASIPLVLYIKESHGIKEHAAWLWVCWLDVAEVIVCLVLQFMGFIDLRESFGLTIGAIAISAISLCGMIAYEGMKNGWNEKIRKSATSLLFCFGGIVLDFVTYFISGGTKTTLIGMIIFLFYIVTQGRDAINEATDLALVGRKAQNFEQMAYHDQLTGLYNRTALAIDTDIHSFDADQAVFVMLDLNDLKKCNDTLGHEKGDKYIRDSAKLIQSVFGDYGKCYRIGGDEFCCIIQDPNHDICKKQIALLPQKITMYNEKSKDIHMAIACGYARFDKRIDYSAEDTLKRADERMYKDKAQQKELMQ